jgi:hypothetical protein
LVSAIHAQKSVTISELLIKKDPNHTICQRGFKTEKDAAFISGVISNEAGRFSLAKVQSGNIFRILL